MKYLILTLLAVLALGGILTYQYFKFHDGKLHIVFCDVGQGDAIIIRTPGQRYVLVDGGGDNKVLGCLANHMPIWSREIDLAILTHPHSDHFLGFQYVKDRYRVKAFATEKLDNKTPGFQLLMKELEADKIPVRYVLQGDKANLGDGVEIRIAGPSQKYLDQTSPGGTIGESKEFASVISLIRYGSFRALLTGDSQAVGLEDAMDKISGPVSLLQAPHHGSATGLSVSLLETLAPKLAVISVGQNNYGHPTLATLQLLTVPGITLKRTDKDGDVEIVSEGK